MVQFLVHQRLLRHLRHHQQIRLGLVNLHQDCLEADLQEVLELPHLLLVLLLQDLLGVKEVLEVLAQIILVMVEEVMQVQELLALVVQV